MKSLSEKLNETFFDDIQTDLSESFASNSMAEIFQHVTSNKHMSQTMKNLGLKFDKIEETDLRFEKNGSDFQPANINKMCKDNEIRFWVDSDFSFVSGVTKGKDAIWMSPKFGFETNRRTYREISIFKTAQGAARLGLNAIVLINSENFSSASIKQERFMDKKDAIAFKANKDLIIENRKRLKAEANALRLTRFVKDGGGKDLLLEAEKLADEALSAIENSAILQNWNATRNMVNSLRNAAYAMNSAKMQYTGYDADEKVTPESDILKASLYKQNSIKSYIDDAKYHLSEIQRINNLV